VLERMIDAKGLRQAATEKVVFQDGKPFFHDRTLRPGSPAPLLSQLETATQVSATICHPSAGPLHPCGRET